MPSISKVSVGRAAVAPNVAIDPLRALLSDPNNMMWSLMGTKPPAQQAVTFGTLRKMAQACQPVQAVILTRQNQVARFARRPQYEGDLGIQVRMKDRAAKSTKVVQKKARELEDVILRCGRDVDPDDVRRMPLGPYLRAIVRDSYTLDAVATEKRYDRRGRLFDWWALDAATIRMTALGYNSSQMIANPYAHSAYGVVGQGYGGVPSPKQKAIRFVQMINSQTYAEFTHDTLAYWIRNPRTDLDSNGYGYPELEMLIEVVTGFLNSMTYNSRYFTHSNVPEGVLGLLGNYTEQQLGDFIRYWNQMVSGVSNSRRIPVMAFKEGKGLQWTPLKQSNKDMEFHAWIDFLVTVVCAIFQCDREEIGFSSRQAGLPGGGVGSENNEQTLIHSQSKGLVPMLQLIESGLNDDIMPGIDETGEFEFTFTGMTPNQEDAKIERANKKLTGGWVTPNEVRNEFDMPPIAAEDAWGDAPVNPTGYQAWMMGKQAQGEAAGGGAPGADPGAGGAPAGGAVPPPPPGPPGKLPRVNDDGTESYDDEE